MKTLTIDLIFPEDEMVAATPEVCDRMTNIIDCLSDDVVYDRGPSNREVLRVRCRTDGFGASIIWRARKVYTQVANGS